MSAVQPPESDPLKGHRKYQRLRHLSGGACGFVVLALDKSTGDLVRSSHDEKAHSCESKMYRYCRGDSSLLLAMPSVSCWPHCTLALTMQ